VNGKIVAGGIVLTAAVMGAGLWYSQQYAYYSVIDPAHAPQMTLVPTAGGAPVALQADDFHGIDATSSPIRFRACFTVATPLPELTAHYAPYMKAEPLLAPGWFSCFNAQKISLALHSGEAKAFLAQKGVAPDVDRVIAVFPDGHAYAWQQLDPAVPVDTSIQE
jgi:hypothetical protein